MLILLNPVNQTAKFLLTSTDAAFCFGGTDRRKENPCSLSYLKDKTVPAGVWDICQSNTFEEYMMQFLSLHSTKIPMTVNNKEPKMPWGQ